MENYKSTSITIFYSNINRKIHLFPSQTQNIQGQGNNLINNGNSQGLVNNQINNGNNQMNSGWNPLLNNNQTQDSQKLLGSLYFPYTNLNLTNLNSLNGNNIDMSKISSIYPQLNNNLLNNAMINQINTMNNNNTNITNITTNITTNEIKSPQINSESYLNGHQ